MPFFAFVLSGSQPPPSNVFKKNFHHSETSSCETSSCASRAIANRSGWVEPGRERESNVMWQSHIRALAVSHCSCFFPALFPSCWTPWCSTWVTILPFGINVASFSMLLLCKLNHEQFFSKGESMSDCEARKLSRARLSANARATPAPGWTARSW